MNVGVVIQFADNGKPRAVNVELADGGKFVIKKEEPTRRSRGRADDGPGTAPPSKVTSSVITVPQPTPTVKTQESLRAVEPVQSSGGWQMTPVSILASAFCRTTRLSFVFSHASAAQILHEYCTILALSQPFAQPFCQNRQMGKKNICFQKVRINNKNTASLTV